MQQDRFRDVIYDAVVIGGGPSGATAAEDLAKAGRKVALLSYNCVGPKEGWATATRAGCAHVRVISHYEMENANPGGPPEAYTFATPDTLEAMPIRIFGQAGGGLGVEVHAAHLERIARPDA